MQTTAIPSGEVGKCQALHVQAAPVESLKGGWSVGSKGDQGVHEADIMLTLQVETAAIGVLKLETSRGKEVPK